MYCHEKKDDSRGNSSAKEHDKKLRFSKQDLTSNRLPKKLVNGF